MSLLDPISLHHRSLLSLAIALSSATWALSLHLSLFFFSTLVLCSLVLVYVYSAIPRSSHTRSAATSTITLPHFITLEELGKFITEPAGHGSNLQKNTNKSSTSPPFLFSSAVSPSTTTTAVSKQEQEQEQQQERHGVKLPQQQQQPPQSGTTTPLSATPSISSLLQRQGERRRLDVIDTPQEADTTQGRLASRNSISSNTAKLDQPLSLACIKVIPKKALEASSTHPDYRIWDHVVIGEGCETLRAACHFALQHPTRTVLVLLEDDIRPTFKQRVMQWLHTKLVAQAQQSWAREALRAVPASLRNAGTSSLATPGIPIAQEPWEIVFDQTHSINLQMLPSNLCIGPSLCATKILLDKPIINAGAAASITSSAPRPVRRFSSIGGGGGDQPHNLTINTITLTPSRTIGLEVATAKDREEARCQLFSKEGVVFASDRHVLIQALGSTTSTPPTSRDAAGRRRSSMLSTETSSQWLKMVFSITMQHHHVRNSREHSTAAAVANFQPYYSLLSMLSKLLDNFDSKERQCSPQDVTADIRPVLLHRSDRVVEYGRARAREEHDISGDQVLQLEISASTASLQASDPIQILVKVITQPMQQDAFGNTEMIRKGEIVLMEGLDMARQMAQAAGWTCLAEDDSHMVEWVRDQMSIQWSSEATSTPLMLLPVSSTLKGLDTFVRSRTTSNGSTRVRTPSLSPYASRTHSYRKLRAEVGEDEKRDSTLARLQEATENLQAHEKEAKEAEEHLTLPNVTIAAAEGSSAGRPGLKTSFGGFSSLSDTRIQTLALAEETEDHLGMALSISPLGGTTSLKERSTIEPSHGGGSGNGAFSEGIGPLDESKPVSPKPRMLSRFSIKSYQLERNNHGLSDEWLIGGGLNTTLGGTQSASTASSGDDFVSTPPLVADNGLSGNVSPLTPSPEALPTTDFLQNLGAPGHRSKLFDRSGHHDQQQALSGNLGKSKHLFDGGIGSGASDDLLSDSLDNSNLVDNGSRKNLTRFGGVSVIGKGGANHAHSNVLNPSPLDAPVELVHDFLGESFSTPPKSLFSRPLLRMDLKTGWDRAQSAPAVPVASSLPMTTKMVHFADSDSLQQQLQQQSKDVLQRVHSEPAVMTTAPLLSQCEPSSLFGDATTRRPSLTAQSSSSSSNSSLSSLSSMSSMSKSKAHTRRSWGQGIGGNDILGIQGLS